MTKVFFRGEEEFRESAEKLFQEQKDKIIKVLPNSQVEHIGSTSIPGSITKGDLDILVRVNRKDFKRAAKELKSLYQINQPENWREGFASFKDEIEGMDFGAQLVVKNSKWDDFAQLRDLIVNNPQYLEEYNQLKQRFEGKEMDEYRREKSDFFEKLRSVLKI